MTTRIRQDPNDGWHHITCHRIEDGDLFEDDTDRWLFLRLLEGAANKFSVKIVSYSLMGNHVHLILHCPEAGVSKFMHHVNGVYASTYNRRHRRIGTLFTDNFYNDLIKTDGQLIFTTRYVDRNAAELGYDIRTYPWASYPAYLRPDELVAVVSLHAQVPLNLAGGAAAYRSFVETDNAADKFSIRNGRKVLIAAPHREPSEALTELHLLARTMASTSTGAVGAQRRQARSAAVLVAHELALGFGEEIRRHFGFNSMSAYTSFLYRAKVAAEANPHFFNALRAAWLGPGLALGQAG